MGSDDPSLRISQRGNAQPHEIAGGDVSPPSGTDANTARTGKNGETPIGSCEHGSGKGVSGERPAPMFTQEVALSLCRQIEAVCPEFGCHVALTGGLLYKDGPRKDADILFYRIRQIESIDVPGLFDALRLLGIVPTTDHGFVKKAKFRGMDIDFFFPEHNDVSGYGSSPEAKP